MTLGGFAGTILVVDLTRGEITKEPLDPGLARDFIGGLGLTVKLAYENLEPGTDAVVVVHRGQMLDLEKVDLYIDRALKQSMAFRRSPNARIFQSFPDESGVAVVKTFVEVSLSHDPGAQDLPVGAVAERFEATDVLCMQLVGPYPRDDSLHAALRKRAEELGLEPTGPPRHYLLSDPDDGEPSGLRQEVQLPVEEKK